MKDYSPIELAISIEKIIIRNKTERKYYRIGRPGLWYGGIATCDCCGCNLKCYFCWSNKPRDFPESTGAFYTPEMIAESLIRTAGI
ncbi:MAG: molybdenum cofactor biosynthesis protein MoaA, partial [candidate division WOR-3 bacterium]